MHHGRSNLLERRVRNLRDKLSEANPVVLRGHEPAEELGLQQPRQGGDDGQDHHDGHALLRHLDVLVDILVLVQEAKLLAEGQRADDVECEVLRLAGKVQGPELGVGGEILALDEGDEAGDLLVDGTFQSLIVFATVLQLGYLLVGPVLYKITK
jgi:hypothetical protein